MTNYTKAAILIAFEELLGQMPFDKITVTALIRKCGIGRNTFYYHYADIYALLDDWMGAVLGSYKNTASAHDEKELLKDFLNHCRSRRSQVYHVYHSVSSVIL